MAELNLVPYKLKESKIKKNKKKQIALILVMAIVALAAIYLIPYFRLKNMINEEESLTSEIASKSSIKIQNTKLNAEKLNYDRYITYSKMVKDQKIISETRITDLQKYIPKDLLCSNITYNMLSINLTGSSLSYNSICEFAANVRMSGKYSSVRINSIVNANDSKIGYKFNINVTYKIGG